MNFLEASLEDVCKEELKQAEVKPVQSYLKLQPSISLAMEPSSWWLEFIISYKMSNLITIIICFIGLF